jgi:hypothetical protein
MTIAYRVTWDRIKHGLDCNNPGFGRAWDQIFNCTADRAGNVKR